MLLDPSTSAVLRVITLQYNADTLSRSLQVQAAASGDGADRSEALRIKSAPAETIKLEAEIDAADQMEFPEQNSNVGRFGIFPQLAVLESLVYPTSAQLQNNNTLQGSGTLEILPMETALTLFVWSSVRVLPVRVTDLSITEEAFDTSLHPIRAKVSLGLRVLSVSDLGFSHKGGNLFMNYLRQKEQLGALASGGALGNLGLRSIP